jgi:adenosylmethionine-8-amino-7-oxononanoate aminotransferase
VANRDELAQDQQYLVHSLHRKDQVRKAHVWVRGEGALLYDAAGREFLDALSGLWNVIVGHGRRELGQAALRQMEQLAYVSSYSGGTHPLAIELGERLAGLCYPGIRRFFFTSGGAEANEAAFKTVRYYWKAQGKPEKTQIISRNWGYHGTTLAAMSATGIASYWPMFEPRVPGFHHVESPYPYRFDRDRWARPNDPRTPGQMAADLVEEAILREGADRVAAFIGEPVQGAGGVIVPPDDYWPRVRQICDRHSVLLIADEVITGFGRTGPWFALSRYGVEPELVTFAKGITSGYFPMGGMGVNASIADCIDNDRPDMTWMHAHTYSAHPVGCAVALANLDLLTREGLVERVATLGERLLQGLQSIADHPHVGDVRGIGLMAAVELVKDRGSGAEFPASESVGARVHQATQDRGMFTRMRGDVYNLAPCYASQEAQIDRMVDVLGESIRAVLG